MPNPRECIKHLEWVAEAMEQCAYVRYSIPFSVGSNDALRKDVTPDRMIEAAIRQIEHLRSIKDDGDFMNCFTFEGEQLLEGDE